MRIDPKGTVGGYPALRVRRLVRTLSTRLYWDLKTVATVLSVTPGEAKSLVEALEGLGFAKARRGKGPKTWRTTQRAQSIACATAAKPITRRTAEAALARFLERVDRVNKDSRFLAKVTRVIVFGSYLRADQDRLGDVDVAVELVPKQRDRKCLRELNYRRVAESERQGHRFSGVLDRESWWQLEPFRFLKGRSRAISLHDNRAEKVFVDQVPHRILISPAAEEERRSAMEPPKDLRRSRRPKGCPF